jgi:hypothetical protein
MNDSLAPVDCSITSNNDVGFIAQETSTILSDTITLNSSTVSSSTITISNGGSSMGYTIGTGLPSMTISSNGNVGIGSGTYTINGVGASVFNWKNEEFVDCMPDFNRIQKMCKEYPGLAIAFEKFKTVYSLVKDHYDTPEDKRPKP